MNSGQFEIIATENQFQITFWETVAYVLFLNKCFKDFKFRWVNLFFVRRLFENSGNSDWVSHYDARYRVRWGYTETVKRELICFSRGNVSHARQLKNRLVLLPVKICCYDVGVILNQECSLGY